MKPLVNYYGGKYNLSREIIKLIPKHQIYIEPFAGGAAVFFRKKLANKNILNDHEKYLVNMYIQYKKNTKQFCRVLNTLPYSEYIYKLSKNYKAYKVNNKLISACFYWYNITNSFSNAVDGGFNGLGIKAKNDKSHIRYYNKLKELPEKILKLKHTTIFCRDASIIVRSFDSENSFFYLDPPYPGADQGHYKGYTIENYKNLIKLLKTIKGKFILSNYYQDIELPKEWYIKKIEVNMTASKSCEKREKRTELLIMNYFPNIERSLFDEK